MIEFLRGWRDFYNESINSFKVDWYDFGKFFGFLSTFLMVIGLFTGLIVFLLDNLL